MLAKQRHHTLYQSGNFMLCRHHCFGINAMPSPLAENLTSGCAACQREPTLLILRKPTLDFQNEIDANATILMDRTAQLHFHYKLTPMLIGIGQCKDHDPASRAASLWSGHYPECLRLDFSHQLVNGLVPQPITALNAGTGSYPTHSPV